MTIGCEAIDDLSSEEIKSAYKSLLIRYKSVVKSHQNMEKHLREKDDHLIAALEKANRLRKLLDKAMAFAELMKIRSSS